MTVLQSPETERGVLGTCLNFIGQKAGWFNRIGLYTDEPQSIFTDPKNRAVYIEMKKFYDNDKEPTIQQIIDQVSSYHAKLFDDTSVFDYVTGLSLNAGTIYNSTQFDNAVADLTESRKIRQQISGMEKIIANLQSGKGQDTSADVAQKLSTIAEQTDVRNDTKTFSEVFQDVRDRDAPTWRISTNIKRLDQVLGGRGIEAGTLITIAARPKVGKTAMMNSLVCTILENGGRPIVLNYETKDIEFASKIIARHEAAANEDAIIDLNYTNPGMPDQERKQSNECFTWSTIKDYLANDNEMINSTAPEDLDLSHIRTFPKQHIELIKDGARWAEQQDWKVSFDKDMSMPGIEALVKEEKEKNVENPRIVLLVDYVQLQVTDSKFEREQITDMTRFYKKIAGKYNIAVVILAQINREGADDPKVEHLKSSGSIEQDSDVILLLSHAKKAGEPLPDHIRVNAGTTRLGQGDIFNVFFDHSLNIVAEADPTDEEAGSANVDDYVETNGYESTQQPRR